jgi:hypothetical protein
MQMRVFLAAVMIALLAGPAFAQGAKGSGKEPAAPKTQTEIDSERAAERAYKNSLGNIPDQAPADPWGGARNLEKPKADKPASTKLGAGKKKPPA